MAKLDKQNRLTIPKNLITMSTTDFSKELRVYLRNNEIFIDNPGEKHRRHCCIGTIKLDCKMRFFVSKNIKSAIGINEDSNITFYVLDDLITFRKIFFIPENR